MTGKHEPVAPAFAKPSYGVALELDRVSRDFLQGCRPSNVDRVVLDICPARLFERSHLLLNLPRNMIFLIM